MADDDTKRLDWLEQTKATVAYRTGLSASRPPWSVAEKGEAVVYVGNTVREAIDRAMKREEA